MNRHRIIFESPGSRMSPKSRLYSFEQKQNELVLHPFEDKSHNYLLHNLDLPLHKLHLQP